MAMLTFNSRIRLAVGVALLAAALTGCARSAPPAATAPTTSATSAPAAAASAAPASAPAQMAQPPASSHPNAPAGENTIPQATAEVPATHTEPALASMSRAEATSKLSVPVDLLYQFDGDASTGQPVTLHLAAVPRITGSNLNVSIKKVPGIQTTALALSAQKASATTAYRQQVSLTRLADAPAQLRVLVTMDLPEGTTFGWFGVPLKPATAPAGKQAAQVQ